MTTTFETVSIQLDDDRGYDILIGPGLLDSPASFEALPRSARALIVTNETVAPLYLARLQAQLVPLHREVDAVILPDGEQFKDWASLNAIVDRLLATVSDRKTVLYALGGGVIGDMTGFAAAIYMRGVPLCRCPPRCWPRWIRPSVARRRSTTRSART